MPEPTAAEALHQILLADMRENGHEVKHDLAPSDPIPAVPDAPKGDAP